MSLLNSKFTIESVDHPVALAAVAQILPVAEGTEYSDNGTPKPGTIAPGAIVTMDTDGHAVLATTPVVSGEGAVDPLLVFVTVDGNMNYSGSFVQKLTVLHGGVTIETDQFHPGAYAPGALVTYRDGRIALRAAATEQIIGAVGPKGLQSPEGVLQVILPQGSGL